MSAAPPDLRDRLLAPVDGPNPAGADVTYEPAFESLRQAVDRLASVGTGVDHENVAGEGPFAGDDGASHADVVAGALDVLSDHAKDLRAAAYLVASLAHTDGPAGVAAGLEALAAMAQAYWADLHPARPRARRAAFEFLASRLPTTVAGWDRPGADEREPLDRALAAVSELQVLVTSELGDDAPALSGVRRALAERLRRVPAPPEAPSANGAAAPDHAGPDQTAAATEPAGEGGGPPAPTPAVTPPGTADGSTESAPASATAPATPAAAAPPAAALADPVRAVVQAAAALREGGPVSAVAVRLLRVVRWDALDAPPPATDGATRLEAPPARRREALVGLAASDPALFLEHAEGAFASPPFHFWLDLQRLADGACAGLGAGYAGVRAALRDEAGRLLARLPGLPALAFRDGTPFADPATVAWAAGLAPADAGPGGAGPSASAGDEALAEARDLVAGGDLAGALDGLGAPPDGRGGLVRRLQMAELCLLAGRADLAHDLLAALALTAERRDLGTWEPDLAADVYAGVVRAARQSGHAEAAADALARLAAVDPARAARLPPV